MALKEIKAFSKVTLHQISVSFKTVYGILHGLALCHVIHNLKKPSHLSVSLK